MHERPNQRRRLSDQWHGLIFRFSIGSASSTRRLFVPQDRVRFLGRQPASAFTDLMLVTDIGVNLRKPPTNGETSGALLNLLAAGVPQLTIPRVLDQFDNSRRLLRLGVSANVNAAAFRPAHVARLLRGLMHFDV